MSLLEFMINTFRRKIIESPIFIGGEGRSGTTLMRAMLNCHPKIACGAETHFLTDQDFIKLYDLLLERYSARFAEYTADPSEKVNEMYRAMINAFYDDYTKKQGKIRWADKTPYNIKVIDFLLKVYSDKIKFIHLIRDGRDVATSMLKMEWGPNTIQEAARSWKEIIQGSRKHLGKDYYIEVKYEQLIAESDKTLKEVCNFIGERYSDKMLDYYKKKDMGGERESSFKQVSKPLYTTSVQKWEVELSRDEIKSYEEIAGEELVMLGYRLSN